MVLAAIAFATASLIPLLQSPKREAFAFFTPAAEMLNGALAERAGAVQACPARMSTPARVRVSAQGHARSPLLLARQALVPRTHLPFPYPPCLAGRAAMIGFAALLIIEGVRGTALF